MDISVYFQLLQVVLTMVPSSHVGRPIWDVLSISMLLGLVRSISRAQSSSQLVRRKKGLISFYQSHTVAMKASLHKPDRCAAGFCRCADHQYILSVTKWVDYDEILKQHHDRSTSITTWQPNSNWKLLSAHETLNQLLSQASQSCIQTR